MRFFNFERFVNPARDAFPSWFSCCLHPQRSQNPGHKEIESRDSEAPTRDASRQCAQERAWCKRDKSDLMQAPWENPPAGWSSVTHRTKQHPQTRFLRMVKANRTGRIERPTQRVRENLPLYSAGCAIGVNWEHICSGATHVPLRTVSGGSHVLY